jgi:hypothetical protein
MVVAAEPGQDGQGFVAGDQPTTTAAADDTGRTRVAHDDTAMVMAVEPMTVVLGEKSRLASR